MYSTLYTKEPKIDFPHLSTITRIQMKNYDKSKVSVHDLGQIGGKHGDARRATSDDCPDGQCRSRMRRQDGLKREQLPLAFCYHLEGLDPFAHLAAEDFLLRSRQGPGLAFWRAKPCVVLGRYQNPWREVHWQKLKARRALMVRRQSGGGCVYQDEGNLNFAFFGALQDLDKKRHLDIICKALADFGIQTWPNPRGDLLCRQGKRVFKISGSALKCTKDRFLHHGTLLVDANLELLRELLNPPPWNIKTKAVASRRSAVINLRDIQGHTSALGMKALIDAIGHYFGATLGGQYLREVENVNSNHLSDATTLHRFTSPQWIWGETPPFDWEWADHNLSFQKGKLQKMTPLSKAKFGGRQGPRFEIKFLQERDIWQESPMFGHGVEALAKSFGPYQIHQLKAFCGQPDTDGGRA